VWDGKEANNLAEYFQPSKNKFEEVSFATTGNKRAIPNSHQMYH
jgi:hypothetical protein